MYWQPYLYRSALTVTNSATTRLDLPESGFLGSILLEFSGDQASGLGNSGGNWRLIDYLTDIEVVGNGSTIIKDLSAKLHQALTWYDGGPVAADVWRNYATNTQFCRVLINFGRYFGDPDFGLQLDDWDNVELRITNAATSSEFTSAPTVNVVLFFLRPTREARSLGFMRSEIWRTWTTVANEWHYLTLPQDLLVRRVVLQAIPAVDSTTKKANTQFTNLLYNVQCYLKTGEVEVYNGSGTRLMLYNYFWYGRDLWTHGHAYLTADRGIDIGVGYPFTHLALATSYTDAAATVVPTATAGQTENTLAFESAETDVVYEFAVKGMAYHNTLVLPFDFSSDPNRWLDARAEAEVQLNVQTRNSSSAADGTVNIVLDRLVRR